MFLTWRTKFPLLFVLLLAATMSFALPFNIVPKSGTTLPTSWGAGQTLFAYYTVTNNTGSQRNSNFVRYLPPNVTQITSGGTYSDTCGSTFNLGANGTAASSCTLQLSISGTVSASDPDASHHLFVCFPGGQTCAGTPYPLNISEGVTVSSISVAPLSASISDQQTLQYTATENFSNGTTANVTNLATWSSSNPTAATISQTGLARGVTGATSTLIRAAYAGFTSAPATLSVTKAIVSIAITPATLPILRIGFTQQYTATATYDDGSTGNVTSTVNWTSSTPSVATISAAGLATGVSPGSTTITANVGTVTSNLAAASVVRFIYGANNSVIADCQLSTNGQASNCVSIGLANYRGSVASPNGKFIYFSAPSSASALLYCPINADGSINSGACASTTNQPGAGNSELAINAAGTFVYIPSNTTTMYSCPVNPATGNTTGACVTSNVTVNASHVAVSPDARFMYADTGSGTNVVACQLNSTGSASGCVNFNTPGAFSLSGLAVDPTGSYLYLAQYNNANNCSVYACPINQTTGIPTCTSSTGVTCGSINSLAVDPLNTFLYTTNFNGGYGILSCSISGANIGGCNGVGATSISYSIGIH